MPPIVGNVIFFVVIAGVIVGSQFFLRWNRRQGLEMQAQAHARGEEIRPRTAQRVPLIIAALVICALGVALLVR